MKILSTLKSYMEPKSKPSSTVPNKIALGDTLTGRVLKVKTDGLALFDFNGTKAWSKVSFPVKEGAQIAVTVIENHPRIKLKLLDATPTASPRTGKNTPFLDFPAENTVRKLQLALGKILGPEEWTFKRTTLPQKIATGIEQLSAHFQQFNFGKGITELSSRLRSYMENSGIFFEKKIENEIQNLYRSHGEIPTRQLHQHPEIRNIIKSDLKPCLLILKHFIQENEQKSQKNGLDQVRDLKPLINRMLENIGFEQTKSARLPQARDVNNPKMVYADPRKGNEALPVKTEELALTISRLTPKLHQFLKANGVNMDEKVHHSFLKVINLFEFIFSKESSLDPRANEKTPSPVLAEDMPQHLKRVAEFFRHQATASGLLDAKDLEDIKKSLPPARGETAVPDPRKEDVGAPAETGKLLPTITRLTPKLHHLLKTDGVSMDEKVHHSFLKVINLFEFISSKESSSDPRANEKTPSPVLAEDMPQHLKRVAEFFRHQAITNGLLDAKDLEDIKKSLSHVRAEIESWEGAGAGTKRAQRPETGQVISFTLPLPEETGKGKLKVFYSKKSKRETDEGFRLSLLLEMKNTGPIRTDFFLLNRQLKITFYLSDHRIEKVILAHADSVRDALAEHFSSVMVDVAVSERKVENFDIEHLSAERTSLIDLRV
jgi:hypothetical protein